MPTGLGPIPMLATCHLAGAQLRVDFDLPLKAGPLDPGNWVWHFQNLQFECTAAAASGTRVTAEGTPSTESNPPDRCSYNPPPYDVLSVCAGVAQAFADFPIAY